MAYNIDLAAGRYNARALSAGAYETPGGALMVGVQWELENPAHDTITSRTCLISKAGVVQEKRIAEIRKWAPGWDGVSTEWFGQHFTEFEATLTIERRVDSYDGKEKPEIAFIDPVGGGDHGVIPVSDQKALGAKFGARLRALAGATPKPMNPPPKPPANPPKPPQGKNAQPNIDAARQTAWGTFTMTYKGGDAERDAAWFALLARAVPGKTDYNAFTADDWGAVIDAAGKANPVADDIPF